MGKNAHYAQILIVKIVLFWMECYNGYAINEGKCSKCSDSCLECYFSNGKEYCTKCSEYYRINEGQCIRCLDYHCLDC